MLNAILRFLSIIDAIIQEYRERKLKKEGREEVLSEQATIAKEQRLEARKTERRNARVDLSELQRRMSKYRRP